MCKTEDKSVCTVITVCDNRSVVGVRSSPTSSQILQPRMDVKLLERLCDELEQEKLTNLFPIPRLGSRSCALITLHICIIMLRQRADGALTSCERCCFSLHSCADLFPLIIKSRSLSKQRSDPRREILLFFSAIHQTHYCFEGGGVRAWGGQRPAAMFSPDVLVSRLSADPVSGIVFPSSSADPLTFDLH